MIKADGRLICDKEIGSYRRGWRACKCPATVRVESKHSSGLFLDYCKRHSVAQSIGQSRPAG